MKHKNLVATTLTTSVRRPHAHRGEFAQEEEQRFPALAALSMAFLSAVAGCAPDGAAQSDTRATGFVSYQDASRDSAGRETEAESPQSQPVDDGMQIRIVARGRDSLQGLEPQCSLQEAAGSFEGLYAGEGGIDGESVYIAAFASSAVSFQTPTGARFPMSKFRPCWTTSPPAKSGAPRTGTTTSLLTASCQAKLLAELSVNALSGGALGDLFVDLTFDHIDDGSGGTIYDIS